ncbi:DUF2065 domain-containing protein [Siculibacillus lacustris]|uniref:DUF2065 domain-containing protein n=1 Tax=Siculibacillus lacustris TaxID=1549641 RepID=A0A4Q9VRW6_9HYPH|nr:DUF2065 domain-containing protein [Siculibacillus lacustris]TBW38672.1 DUF2065 domain-containing protein [Siculibacillus lacustris]
MTLGPGTRDLIVAVGLVLAIEGAVYAAAPGPMKRLLAQMRMLPDNAFRIGGLVALVAGVAIVWAARG